MALIVEDGTGKVDAESYASVADADSYHTKFGSFTDWDAFTTAQKEVALRKATQYLDGEFRNRYLGRRTNDDQALEWPREFVVDSDDIDLDDDVIPQELIDATSRLALDAATDSDLYPVLTTPGAVKRTRDKVGPLESEIEYQGSASQRKDYNAFIERLIRRWLIAGNTVERS